MTMRIMGGGSHSDDHVSIAVAVVCFDFAYAIAVDDGDNVIAAAADGD